MHNTQGALAMQPRHVLTRAPDDDRYKARLTVKGYGDPDLRHLVRHGETQSPTVSQHARAVALPTIASRRWMLRIGDMQGARGERST